MEKKKGNDQEDRRGGFSKFRKENNKYLADRHEFSVRKKKPKNTQVPKVEKVNDDGSSRLNKYVANAGICSRRAADILIADGEVLVNNVVVKEPGYRVKPGDNVTYKGRTIKPVEQKIYILLNKPKDVITTLSDEKGRKSIDDLLKGKVSTHVFPVGRLDRDTTGLLLITNDGDLTRRLSHPSYEVKKIYHATLNKPMEEADLNKIRSGLQLEDGYIKVDGISYVKNAPPNELGITLHSGRNRIIRRIFEYLGYEVIKLDRVYYAGLTKKDLPRGRMRFLTKEEVIRLKHFKA
ncbi:MAG: rRNA pseudouridine synthase [Saprospiraceae bacterium]|nr:rRNA pseudouridine synthase [Saprospiraceae bacterium]